MPSQNLLSRITVEHNTNHYFITLELEMFLVAPKRTEMKNSPINQSVQESTV